MIICSTNLSYLNLNFKEFISVIKKIGYKNIELAPYVYRNKYTIKNIIEIKKKLKDEKIRIKSLQSIFSNMDIKNNDFSLIKKAMYNRIDNIIRIAKILNIKKISYGSSPSRKLTNNKKNYNLNILIIKRLAKKAKGINAILLVEPLSKIYNNNFLLNTNEVIKCVNKLNIINLKTLIDTGNILFNKTNFEILLKDYYKEIMHIHISNSNIFEYNNQITKKYLNYLHKKKYDSTVTIEFVSKKGLSFEKQRKILSWNKK